MCVCVCVCFTDTECEVVSDNKPILRSPLFLIHAFITMLAGVNHFGSVQLEKIKLRIV